LKSTAVPGPSIASLSAEMAVLREHLAEARLLAISFAGAMLAVMPKGETEDLADKALRILRLGAVEHAGFLAAIDDVEIIAKGTAPR
jgi:hypothetical protein